MPTAEGVEAWIATPTGARLKEYSSKVDMDGRVVTCYLESTGGHEFRPSFSRPGVAEGTLEGVLRVDGVRYRGKVNKKQNRICTWTGARDGLQTERPFTFGQLKTTDDDEIAAMLDEATLKALGEVNIEIWRVQAFNKHDLSERKQYGDGPVIHESSKKATLSHSTSLGPQRTITSRGAYHTKKLDKVPLVTFRFLYRSRNLLEAEGLLVDSSGALTQLPDAKPAASTSTNRKPVKREVQEVIDLDSNDYQPGDAYRFERSPSPQ